MTTSSHAVTPSQVEAMISLLDDDNAEVVSSCQQALIASADMAEPMVREALGDCDAETERPLLQVLTEIVSARAESELISHLRGDADLEEGSRIIGRLIDPGEGPDVVGGVLDALSQALQPQLDEEDADGRRQLTELLVQQHGLVGAPPNEVDRLDAVLHGAIERRRGLPLPLSIVWVLVARRCGLPVVGLDMPAHFLIRYGDAETGVILDPFHHGAEVSREECIELMKRNHAGDALPTEASDRGMLVRTLANLRAIAQRDGDQALVDRCGRLMDATGMA